MPVTNHRLVPNRAAAKLVQDLAKRDIILKLHRTGNIEIFNDQRLTLRDRQRIDLLVDELIEHLRAMQPPKELIGEAKPNLPPRQSLKKPIKVATRRLKGWGLTSVIEMKHALTARLYGNGEPRKPPKITMRRCSMRPKKIGPRVSVVRTADDAPRAA